jgi:hypothetical protein
MTAEKSLHAFFIIINTSFYCLNENICFYCRHTFLNKNLLLFQMQVFLKILK